MWVWLNDSFAADDNEMNNMNRMTSDFYELSADFSHSGGGKVNVQLQLEVE